MNNPMNSLGPRALGTLYVAPMTLWFLVFFLIPLIMILVFSFLKADIDGGILPEFSLAAYQGLLSPRLGRILFSTLWVSVVSTVATILLALPAAYFMARSRHKNILLILIIIPFWTNFIIRVFAWKSILEANGVINSFLLSMGWIADPLMLEHNWIAVIIINVYSYLTYAILPLYSTIEKFDFTQLEAARDLGATKLVAIRKILIPSIRPGLVTAVFFTFIPFLGSFVVPQLIGTKDMYLLGNEINDSIYKYFDWPTAYAIGVVMMLITNVGLMFMLLGQREKNP